MGSDYAMNPPRPASYAAMASVGLGAVAIYKYPAEFDQTLTAGLWHRVVYVHFHDDEMRVREAVANTAKALGVRMKEVESDAVMERTIHPDIMRDILNPKPTPYEPKHAWAKGNLQHHLIFDHELMPTDVMYGMDLNAIHADCPHDAEKTMKTPTNLHSEAGERMPLRLESEICSRGAGVYTARIVVKNSDNMGEAVLCIGESRPTMDEAHGSAIHYFGEAMRRITWDDR